MQPELVQLTADEAKFLAQSDGQTKFSQAEIDRIIGDAADERIEDEIALFVGHGNLDVENVENPGLQIVFSRLDDYAEASIARHEAWQDSVETAMLERLAKEHPTFAELIEAYLAAENEPQTRAYIPPDYEIIETRYAYGPWGVNHAETIAPMIPVEWGQMGVFNDRAEAEEGTGTAAGCVGIATVQLMTFWEHPTSYHGLNLTPSVWHEMGNWSGSGWSRYDRYKNWYGPMDYAPANIKQTVADLIWYIGEDVDMNWGTSSGADSKDAINLLKSLGYSASSQQNLSSTTIKTSLNNGRPVYVRGEDPSAGGHAWLVDGSLSEERNVTITYTISPIEIDVTKPIIFPYVTEEYTESRDYFHNNWGLDGSDNGYYAAGIFDPINGEDFPSNTRSYDFSDDIKMWTDIYR